MRSLHDRIVDGLMWPGWFEDGNEPSQVQMANHLAQLDAESSDDWEALFYGLLDLPGDELVKVYLSRL
jgi:hypothetical protein